MSETNETPAAPQPFQLPPVEPRPGGRGCSKPVWIGCGALLVLLFLSMIFFMVKLPKIFEWALGKAEVTVTEKLPDDATPEERERLRTAFQATGEAVLSGQADPFALQQLQQPLSQAMSAPGQMTHRELLRLIEALEAVAGIESEERLPESTLLRDVA